MDPNLFAVDMKRVLDIVLLIALLAIFVERALALFFESRLLTELISGRGVKELLAFGVCFGICLNWDFDAISALMPGESTQLLGHALTGAVIAGGSKGSIRLFHALGVMSSAERERQQAVPS